MDNIAGRFISAVDENEFLKKICGVLLALCPILQHYRGIGFNAAVVLIIAVVPYLVIRIMGKLKDAKLSDFTPVLMLMILQIYTVINHGTSVVEMGEAGVYIIYLSAIALGCIDLGYFVRASSFIALAACAGIMLQYVCFYIFGFHLQMVPTDLLLKSAQQWILGAQTGLAGITGVIRETYRPSAFFLEPSHMYLYLFPHLALFMFGGKGKKESLYPAIFISVGLILTTSGMGIAATGALWILYFIMKDDKDGSFSLKNIFRPRVIKIFAVFIVIGLLMVAFIPFVRVSVVRIFVPITEGGSTAIGGRLNKALEFLGTMPSEDYLFGVSDKIKGADFNIPGIIEIFYKHGIIGTVLSYSIYIMGLFKAKLPNGVICLGVLATSLFSAHTHATVGMLNFVLLIMSGYEPSKRRFLN